MSFTDKYADVFRRILPAPFTIALILTLISFVLVLTMGSGDFFDNEKSKLVNTLDLWYQGLWDSGGFKFAMQMMLMLLLGHVVALSKPIDNFLNKLSSYAKDNASAAVLVTFTTIVVSLFNWGLGLVFGALFARKIGEKATKERWSINYGLIGACGYVGLMVWHGGLSGSAPIKAADPSQLVELMKGSSFSGELPTLIPMTETVFSTMNILVSITLLIMLSLLALWLGRSVKTKVPSIQKIVDEKEVADQKVFGAERLDASIWIGRTLGIGLLCYVGVRIYYTPEPWMLKFITPDFMNFTLLALALLFHGSIKRTLDAVGQAIGGVSGILLQFPLYYGILSLMQGSGLMNELANSVSSISDETTFPLMTFFSAGVMNVFVPSGGGQWVVQGPVIIETAVSNHLSLSKGVMAMAYGDQLTNMLQPFWALPLLAITGLKAKEILPYTLLFMLAGVLIFSVALIFL
ncbi:TIGR00366 family protein [Parvicella tangerina]|uniref:Short-chain fatty acid transporter n=1 Tax=Parvicella tangerina TaxID=2829795 RepID=A0A916JK80_9FLAO|nr:TIGR00366 family protein [Parvicella tangerina]CAG5077857.1 Putative short-chain fatty acid transporter [Parvicella tangerina]